MSYKTTKVDKSEKKTITVKTLDKPSNPRESQNWWKAKSKAERGRQLLETIEFLKTEQAFRHKAAGVHAKLYGNIPLFGMTGAQTSSLGQTQRKTPLPIDRPTMNVVQSGIDTLVSRLTQQKPRPYFLTDGGDYKQRKLAMELNQFTSGEFYQTRAYEKGETVLRDASILGDGALKIYETDDKKVGVERTLVTELYVDFNDAFNGEPRSLYHTKLIDRSVLAQLMPDEASKVANAEQAYPDDSEQSQKTMSDQVLIVEAWHLPSAKGGTDGRHTIACTAGVLCDEEYKKSTFPFVFMRYNPRMVGFWSQGAAEQVMGTQVEINKLLITITQSINLVGVPRVFVEQGSKVVKAHLNNQIGAIVTYSGTKPEYAVAPCVPVELYSQLERLKDYAFEQLGVSQLSATGKKPAGLNSGTAQQVYDDIQSDRFATLEKRYRQMYIDLAYQITEKAREIAERDGAYQTVFPDKYGTATVDLPASKLLEENPFVIQCFDTSSLPRDPAGRTQRVVELMQAGVLSMSEGRRLIDFPDLEQTDRLSRAAEERCYSILDEIIFGSKYEAPDPFLDIAFCEKAVVDYYNWYQPRGLPEKKLQELRDWQAQVMELKAAAQTAAAPPQPTAGAPQAAPEAPPTSPMLPNAAGAA